MENLWGRETLKHEAVRVDSEIMCGVYIRSLYLVTIVIFYASSY